MPISFDCDSCGKTVRAPDKLTGRKVKCPQCAAVVTVPAGAASAEAEDERPRKPAASASREPREEPRPAPMRKVRARDDDGDLNEDDRNDDEDDRNRDRNEDEDRPRRKSSPDSTSSERKRRSFNVLGIISLCLSGVAMIFAVWPCVGLFSLPFSGIALLLALIGLIIGFAGGKWGLISPSIGLVLSSVAIATPFISIAVMGYLVTGGIRKIEAADTLYSDGKKDEAVAIYKMNINSVPDDRKNVVYQRIVDFDVEQGNDAEAELWVEKAYKDRGAFGAALNPDYQTQKAKDMHAALVGKHSGKKSSSRIPPSSSGPSPSSISLPHINWDEPVFYLFKGPPEPGPADTQVRSYMSVPPFAGQESFVFAKAGERVWFDKDFAISKLGLPGQLDGSILLVRGIIDSRVWLSGADIMALKAFSVYAVVRVKDGQGVKVDQQMLSDLSRAGWLSTNIDVTTTTEKGEIWQWRVLQKSVKKGEKIGDLP